MRGRAVPPKVEETTLTPRRLYDYWVEQAGEQTFYVDEDDRPTSPYLLLHADRAEGIDAREADTYELEIPYCQLEELIRVLLRARDLTPPAAHWQKVNGQWELTPAGQAWLDAEVAAGRIQIVDDLGEPDA